MTAKFETPERNVILTMTETETQHLAYILFQRSALEGGLREYGCYSEETIQNVLDHANTVASMIRALFPHGDLGERIRV